MDRAQLAIFFWMFNWKKSGGRNDKVRLHTWNKERVNQGLPDARLHIGQTLLGGLSNLCFLSNDEGGWICVYRVVYDMWYVSWYQKVITAHGQSKKMWGDTQHWRHLGTGRGAIGRNFVWNEPTVFSFYPQKNNWWTRFPFERLEREKGGEEMCLFDNLQLVRGVHRRICVTDWSLKKWRTKKLRPFLSQGG